jgi:NADPH-dependent 2,4-dienoyl-CoA reductase/sulfur reductase-like enzyme/nitrite reductase/ring-hydroxylating ferredoxin subunit
VTIPNGAESGLVQRFDEETTMADENTEPKGPDLTLGVALSDFVDGRLVGRFGKDEVLLVRTGSQVFAVAAHCTHYHGPLAEGIVVGDTVRCPWHHACFNLESGEAVRAPALNPLERWMTVERDGRIFVTAKGSDSAKERAVQFPPNAPKRIVIVGGGAAGFPAAEMLRRRGFSGSLVMLSDDSAYPVDRPNLSKDYLAGSAPEDWLPLKPDEFYRENGIELRLNTEVVGIDTKARDVRLKGASVPYDRLLLATGAEPVRLKFPGSDQRDVFTLRTVADCRAIIERAKNAKRALVIGASFIGLEVAASLRARNIEVHVVAPEARPLERIFGREMGDFVRALHEEHGVVFHLEDTVAAIDKNRATLKSGATLEVDFTVMGVGVRPRVALAEQAGLKIDRGVVVDAYLETSAPGVYAAGDIARWPDPHSAENIRVEHWVVAERQGQTAAKNMLGLKQRFDHVPFFWSQHYDVPINYVGHAESWDAIEIEGDIKAKDCLLRYKKKGRVLAVASIFRDRESLEAELAMEPKITSAV